MSEKKEKEFVKVPQVEIDGKKFHESAQVSFGIVKETDTQDVGGNKVTKRTYKLVKYIVVREKVVDETIVRQEEGGQGKITVLNQMQIEVRKEMQRLEGEK